MTGRITPGAGVLGYELRLEGHVNNPWCDWDSGLTVHHGIDGTTTLRSTGLDQAALHGVLAGVRDLAPASSLSRPDEAHAGCKQPGEPGREPEEPDEDQRRAVGDREVADPGGE
jgi:hypothetical protein